MCPRWRATHSFPLTSREEARPQAIHPRRVLVVEDNRDAAELLRLALTPGGHDTKVTHSAAEALALLAEFQPEVAFLDIAMPGMDGIELARALRGMPALAECRIVAITGCHFPAQRAPSPPLFDMHLVKPLDIRQLQRIVLSLDHCRSDS
ncbi:MAG: response regulator [Myxococcales bacterium]